MLLIYFGIIICMNIYENQFTTKDCYKSFSNHEEYFEFLHYYPSGPPYIFLTIKLILSSYIFGFMQKETIVYYHLKRINESCHTSLKFSTIGNDFKEMNVLIEIRLIEDYFKIGDIAYTFYQCFYPEYYIFIDENENFGVVIPVFDVKNAFIAINSSSVDAESFLESLSLKNGEICIITENDRGVVLKPRSDSFIIHGLITSVYARFIKDGEIFLYNKYHAFGCRKNNHYPNEQIVFIIDKVKYDLTFELFYWQIIGKEKFAKSAIFKISNEIFVDLDNMYSLPQNYKKVFLVKTAKVYKKLPNGIELEQLITINNAIFLSKELHEIEVSRGVRKKLWVCNFTLN